MTTCPRRTVVWLGVLGILGGCRSVPTAHNLAVARMDHASARFGTAFTYMVDNAIARDMSVADVHFFPHTTELNGIGEVRLTRMAELLKTYGGTVRYETLETDETLVNERIAHVREFLAAAGCDMDRVEVTAAMSGGRGLPGDEAVDVMYRGTKQAEGTSSTTQPLILTGGSSSGGGSSGGGR
ncbi:MAG: hypothetical protein D6788_03590 [Planctomycetota bacterium]|nr:MAG: hypothetical protein D6788_03590 [Planctomycetota bacterium]